jgi:putative endonuclease
LSFTDDLGENFPVRPELVEGLPLTFWTYMLHCRGGYFYVGHTDSLERRLDQHERSIVPGFVRDHWPAKLVWSGEFPTRYEAISMELRLKGWSRAKKLALIRDYW